MIKTKKDLRKSIPNFEQFHRSLLIARKVVDTGKLAEFYCRKLFLLKQVKPHNASVDAVDSRGKKIEIKYRFILKKTPPGMKINLKRIDFVLYVELDKRLLPARIFKVETKDIHSTRNGRVSFREAFRNKKAELVYSHQ